ncbi:MAG: HlyC/CorC family transporter [Myxococcales bacterium]|nr:HlyC/CorC family transporter [Myxococcales bacterium]
MSSVGTELVIIFVLLVINGLLSMAEMAVVSSRKNRLQQWADDGDRGAARALLLATNPGRMLSTVQVGITLVGIVAGVFSGAAAASALEAGLVDLIPALAPYGRFFGIGIMVTLVTFCTIVVGELVPKQLALRNPEKLAAALSGMMNTFSKIASPLVSLLDWTTKLLMKLLGQHGKTEEPAVTDDDLLSLVEQGTEAGVFDAAEKEMFERVLLFSDKTIRSIMTPRPDMVWLDMADSFDKIRAKIGGSPHSHYPVIEDGADSVIGTVHIKDVYCKNIQSTDQLRDLLTPPLFVPESANPMNVVELFKKTGKHIAIIVDEYGGVDGIVTATDLLEALVGELPSDGHAGDTLVQKRDDGTYFIDGQLPFADLEKLLDTELVPGGGVGEFQTAAGFVLAHIKRIPKEAESFETAGFRFEVIDMDGNRIDKLWVSRVGHNPT